MQMIINVDTIEILVLYNGDEEERGSADKIADDRWDCQYSDGNTHRQCHAENYDSAINALRYWRQELLGGKGAITALATFQVDPIAVANLGKSSSGVCYGK